MTAPWHTPTFVHTEGLSVDDNNVLLCRIHVAIVWFVVSITVRVISWDQKAFLKHRFKWLKQVPAPRCCSVLVENVPEGLRSDEAVFSYFAALFGIQAIRRAYVVRRTS